MSEQCKHNWELLDTDGCSGAIALMMYCTKCKEQKLSVSPFEMVEYIPTPEASSNCPICGIGTPHVHSTIEQGYHTKVCRLNKELSTLCAERDALQSDAAQRAIYISGLNTNIVSYKSNITELQARIDAESAAQEMEKLRNQLKALQRGKVKHVGECATNPIAEQVCNAIYQERTDDNLGLCEALRAIYALCGEDEQIVKIIKDALEDYGVGER